MGKSKRGGTNFLVQGSILAVASIISRIIGLVYRIPMNAILGDVGNGYYSCAFDVYNVILIIHRTVCRLRYQRLFLQRSQKDNIKHLIKC